MKKKIIAMSVLTALLMGNVSAFAAKTTITQIGADTVEISLDEFTASSAVGISVKKDNKTDFEDEFYTDASGKITIKYRPQQSSGLYTVYITEPDNAKFEKAEKKFTFMLPETQAQMKAAFINALDANYPSDTPAGATAAECLKQFYIDFDEFLDVLSDSVYTGLKLDGAYDGQLKTFEKIAEPAEVDMNSIKLAFYEAVFLEKLAEDKSLTSVKDLLANPIYDEYLDFTGKIPKIDDKFALYALSDTLAGAAVNASSTEGAEKFIEDLNWYVFKSIIENATYYTDVKNALGAYAKMGHVNVDITKYDSNADSTLPLKAMMGKSYSNYSAAANAFNNYTYNTVNNGGGGSSSSGSSSGSKSNAGSFTVVNNAPATSQTPTVSDTSSDNSGYPSDIEDVAWAKDYIKDVYDAKIMVGDDDNNFRPLNYITRAETAVLLCKMIESQGMIADLPFTDVNTEDWFFPYVSAAYKNKLFSGKSADTFSPKEGITREEMATVLYRLKKVEKSESAGFADSDEISDWAREAVDSLSAEGIITGDESGRFNPKKLITRAEAAVMLSRLRGAK